MKPPGTIGRNLPHITRTGTFDSFESISGLLYLFNRIAYPWHGVAISKNPGCDRTFKSIGCKHFEVEIYRRKNYKIQI